MPATLQRSTFADSGFLPLPGLTSTPEIYRRGSQEDVTSDRSPWGGDDGWKSRGNFLQGATLHSLKVGLRQRLVPVWQGISPRLVARLQQIQLLLPGWDGDDAPRIAPAAVAAAQRALETLASSYLNFREPVIIPKYDGYLQLEWHDRERTLEFEAVPGGWSIMGAVQSGESMNYVTSYVGNSDSTALEAAYRWWAERTQVWPLR